MEFTVNDLVSIVMMVSGWIGIYAGFRVRLSVLEKEVNDLRGLVTELRHDIKALLTTGGWKLQS